MPATSMAVLPLACAPAVLPPSPLLLLPWRWRIDLSSAARQPQDSHRRTETETLHPCPPSAPRDTAVRGFHTAQTELVQPSYKQGFIKQAMGFIYHSLFPPLLRPPGPGRVFCTPLPPLLPPYSFRIPLEQPLETGYPSLVRAAVGQTEARGGRVEGGRGGG